jgi:adenosylhomocysteine nucleosidase
MPAKVAIISALDRELAPLLKKWQRGLLQAEGRVFPIWKSEGVVYVPCGMGAEHARTAARLLVAREKPSMIVSAGFAGALTRMLTVGEVITPGTVIDAQTGKNYELGFGTGVLVTVPVVADEAAKKGFAKQFRADAVDMEAAAVAQTANEHGVVFCAVKAISDELGFAMPPFNAYINGDGSLAVERFAAHVAVRPGYWPSLMKLACNSKKAAQELSSTLEHLVESVLRGQSVAEAVRMISPTKVVN